MTWKMITDFLQTLHSVDKKIGQFLFHIYLLTFISNDISLLLCKRNAHNPFNPTQVGPFQTAHALSSADIIIFSPELCNFSYINKYRYRLHFDT